MNRPSDPRLLLCPSNAPEKLGRQAASRIFKQTKMLGPAEIVSSGSDIASMRSAVDHWRLWSEKHAA